ncbi:TMEM43 family protein [Rhizobium sp. Root708]|uniref:TMEM43 family protein n=1 Tax=Rhizobium sp. Root708 TaxID=1736592 RepID=UPI000A5CF014|nr:TMEM43 family protein [Rhizobium sp. Root708]
MFGVSAENAVAISRSVEMYQWVEKRDSKTEKKVGGGEETTTTYTYGKEWRSEPVRSSEFKHPEGHDNPDSMPASETFMVAGTHVGAFEVPAQMVADVGQRAGLAITDNDVSAVAAALGGDRPVKRSGEGAYVGERPSDPSIGDLKLSFDRVDAKEASFVGKQQGSSLTAYTSGNGREIFLNAGGRVDAASMFKSAESDNNVIAWLLRVAGLVLMFIGFVCIFTIFGIIGDVIPFIGSIVSFGTSLLAFILTLVLGSLAIAFGWLAYRPLLAAGIIVVALVVAVVVIRRRSAVAKPV